MKAIELRNILIRKISEIDDVAYLKAIESLLNSKTRDEVLTLSETQRKEIIASKKEIEQGLFVEHTDFDKEIKAWLKEK